MRPIKLFTLRGVTTATTPASLAFFALAALGLAGAAAAWSGLTFGEALLAGGLGALGMWVSDWLHQMGHALAAARAGHPMTGILFTSVLSVSQYPADEPALPARVHIQRALGGFWVNVLIGLLLLPYWFFLSFENGASGWTLGWLTLWNLGVLGLGALLPIDIPNVLTSDGGTLRRYWSRRKDA